MSALSAVEEDTPDDCANQHGRFGARAPRRELAHHSPRDVQPSLLARHQSEHRSQMIAFRIARLRESNPRWTSMAHAECSKPADRCAGRGLPDVAQEIPDLFDAETWRPSLLERASALRHLVQRKPHPKVYPLQLTAEVECPHPAEVLGAHAAVAAGDGVDPDAVLHRVHRACSPFWARTRTTTTVRRGLTIARRTVYVERDSAVSLWSAARDSNPGPPAIHAFSPVAIPLTKTRFR